MDAGLGPIEEEKETKMSWSVVDMWHVVDDPWRSTRWRPARGGCGRLFCFLTLFAKDFHK
jgi:hypothetical protein